MAQRRPTNVLPRPRKPKPKKAAAPSPRPLSSNNSVFDMKAEPGTQRPGDAPGYMWGVGGDQVRFKRSACCGHAQPEALQRHK